MLPAGGASYASIEKQLDGPSAVFGRRFLAWLRPLLEKQGHWHPGSLTGITYTDRYVRSPLVAHLLYQCFAEIARTLGREQPLDLLLRTNPLGARHERAPHLLCHDWQIETDRLDALAALFSKGWRAQINVGNQPHSRTLELRFAASSATILLDQGVGFIEPRGMTRFDFDAKPAAQATTIRALDIDCLANWASFGVVLGK